MGKVNAPALRSALPTPHFTTLFHFSTTWGPAVRLEKLNSLVFLPRTYVTVATFFPGFRNGVRSVLPLLFTVATASPSRITSKSAG
ncbi:hypothetical protein SAMN00790413_01500 [Deinococcus hopiensis KR-140]|uniref:Uncharacterized protein n=1 Tax=Deinococcus hopiensis KR-140 TaxID=695939 RepID=A0A1W1VFT9_9DEIO|nr:hypothetical protein SAMN00790413_01500 [Deinococcus hopiensis KR-140]